MTVMDLGRVGVWAIHLASPDGGDVAAELEDLGYGTLWFPGGFGGGEFDIARRLLAATTRVPVATGILNLWAWDPAVAASEFTAVTDEFGDRFLLAIGVSHAALIDLQEPGRYQRPLSRMTSFLDGLDAATPTVAPEHRALAALRPRMLALAAERSAGVHSYFVPVEHTAAARERLGDDALLAPEQAVVLETDPTTARAAARAHMAIYLGLPNYTDNLRQFGFDDGDFADGGSDRLVDAVVAWGDEAAIRRRVEAHLDAGADHVCVQDVTEGMEVVPHERWRRLAPALAELSTDRGDRR